ncbi:MAG: Calx-beta domain-containing protein, partial [bacterium]
PAYLTVTLSPAEITTATVNYAVTDGTATGGGVDYTLAPGTITFAPGETSKNILITIADDLIDEPEETIFVSLSSPMNAILGNPASHTYTILDDEPPPAVQFTAASSNVAENISPANLTVTLSSASATTISVNYAVTGGTATGGGVDYTLAPGTLAFAPGQTSKTILIAITDDLIDEPAETIVVSLSSPVNAILGSPASHTCTIVDNESLGREMAVTSVRVANSQTFALPVVLTSKGNENAVAFSVDFDTSRAAFISIEPGADLPEKSSIMRNSGQAAQGRLGMFVGLDPDVVFASGTHEILKIWFKASATMTTTTWMRFGDAPTPRTASDPGGYDVYAVYRDGTVTIATYEADVSPRPGGNGAIMASDWTQIGRFVVGIDQPTTAGEFQRADCAPRNPALGSYGNGQISVADWTQCGRYTVGLDPLTLAAGVTQQGSGGAGLEDGVSAGLSAEPDAPAAGREVLIVDTPLDAGTTGTVPVQLNSLGDENAITFSVVFDPTKLTYAGTAKGAGLPPDSTLIKNETQSASGRVGLLAGLQPGTAFSAGARELVTISFMPAAVGGVTLTPVNMGASPTPQSVSDSVGNDLTAAFTGGTVTINPPSGVGAWPLY